MIHGNSSDIDGPYRKSIRAVSFSTESGRHTGLSLVSAILWKAASLERVHRSPSDATIATNTSETDRFTVFFVSLEYLCFCSCAVVSAQRLM
jgi:hypothetical protein